jgi:GTP-binding protein
VLPRVDTGAVKLLVLLTKADKLSRAAAEAALAAAQDVLGGIMTSEQADVGVTPFSALDRRGVADAAVWLRSLATG